MRDRDIRDQPCEFPDCAHPARYRVSKPGSAGFLPWPDGGYCGVHMHALARQGWTVEGKLRKDGR